MVGDNTDHEQKYVYGKGAGIQRFKDENHGLDHENNLLPECGLIAYVKQNDFQYWFVAINQWIVDASWNGSEKLEIVFINGIARLKSKHIRKGGSEVLLSHFWLKV
jgi:hypothetical protein